MARQSLCHFRRLADWLITVLAWLALVPLAAFSLWLMVVGIMCQGC